MPYPEDEESRELNLETHRVSVMVGYAFEEKSHQTGDRHCPVCCNCYPTPCGCGGLMHGYQIDELEYRGWVHATKCDRCGRVE